MRMNVAEKLTDQTRSTFEFNFWNWLGLDRGENVETIVVSR